MHAQPYSGARCLISGRTLRLLPYFMYANREGSGETAHLRSLARAFTGRLCDKYHNLVKWLNWISPYGTMWKTRPIHFQFLDDNDIYLPTQTDCDQIIGFHHSYISYTDIGEILMLTRQIQDVNWQKIMWTLRQKCWAYFFRTFILITILVSFFLCIKIKSKCQGYYWLYSPIFLCDESEISFLKG